MSSARPSMVPRRTSRVSAANVVTLTSLSGLARTSTSICAPLGRTTGIRLVYSGMGPPPMETVYPDSKGGGGVGGRVFAAKHAPRGPVFGRGAPERVRGAQAERQEDGGAEV